MSLAHDEGMPWLSQTRIVAQVYERDGFVFPIDVISADEAEAIRSDLEAAEAELADQPGKTGAAPVLSLTACCRHSTI